MCIPRQSLGTSGEVMMTKRRYEILLPAQYNDGREVMQACMHCFSETLMAVADQFGAFSYNPHSIMGVWTADGHQYHDELFRLTVDVEDTAQNRQFVTQLKAELRQRFEQLEIYVVAYPVEVL
jgi:hypothetical protein